MTDTVSVRITATENASGVFAKVGKSAETAGQSIERAGKAGGQGLDSITSRVKAFESEINTVGQSLAVFGAGVTALFAASAGKSLGLESAMANFNSIAGQTDAQLASTTNQVRALAVEMGKSPAELAAGLYDITSSGFEAAEAMTVLTAATVAGVAGLTSTSTAAKAITSVLNAYSLGADKAGDVSDVLFETVNRGVITFDQLANNLGNTIPLAAQLGVGIEELGAAYAELTLQGISASQSETAIAALMRSTLNETEALTAAVQAYGFTSAEALIQTEGLAGFLTFLTEASGGSSAALLDLLGTSEAMTAALGLMRNGGTDFIATLDAMNAAAQDGATTQGVFAVQSETTAFALQRLGAAFENLQITAGNALAPIIGQVADAGSALALAFNAVPEPVQTAASVLGAFTGASALAVGGLLILVPKVAETVAAFQKLRASSAAAQFSSLAATAGPLAVALGAVAVIGGSLALGWLEQKQAAQEYNATLLELDDTLFQIQRRGNQALVDQANEATASITALQAAVEASKPSKGDDQFAGIEDPGERFDAFNAASQQFAEDLKAFEANVTQTTANINAALNNPDIDPTAYLDWIERLNTQAAKTETNLDDLAVAEMTANTTLEEYTSTVGGAVEATDKLGREFATAASEATKMGDAIKVGITERTKNLTDAQTDFIANGANILDFWLEYSARATEAARASEELLGGFALTELDQEFVSLVRAAEGLYDAGVALDSILGTFAQIDTLGQRSASAGSIADALIGAPGELGALQDLWARIQEGTSNAALSQEQYNNALTAGVAIQESNARVQDDLNVIRANQIPLLAEQQAAYEANINAISRMTDAQAQQQAIALQDAEFRSKVAEQYATAYAASLDEIPEEVATNLIVSAAESDPILKDTLLSMGLIEEGADGEIRVIFPDGPTVQESVAALTESIDALVLALTGEHVFHADADTEAAQAGIDGLLAKLRETDGQSATVSVNVAGPNGETSLGAGDGGPLSGLIADMFGGDQAVEVEVIPVWQAEPTFGDGTGGGTAPITVPATAEVQDVTMLPSTGDGPTVPVTAEVTEVDTTAFEGLAQDVTITVTQVGMEVVIGLAHATTNAVEGIPTSHATSITESGAAGVIGLAHGATNAINAIPGSHHTSITMSGAEAAIGNAHAVANAINAIPGSRTSTITTNIVTAYSTIGSPSATGGVPELAVGGITARMGELGPEQLYFAAGGTAPVFQDRNYVVPPMTYVSPAHANPQLRGGGDTNVTVIVQGSLVTERELREGITRDIGIGLRDELNRHRTASGVN